MDTTSAATLSVFVIGVAGADVAMVDLVALINAAYKVGEAGIFVDTPEQPFERVTMGDVHAWIAAKNLLIATDTATGRIVGCVKVEVLSEEPNVGEWGCLAVDSAFAGQGLGSKLVAAVRIN
jgi:ribosomal protein S18 acetylase RimI-like enzyme